MTKKILVLLTVLFVAVITTAQIHDPVKWHLDQKVTSETTADIIIKATIDNGWHVYGLQLPEGGPRPTTIVFETIKNAKKEGELKATTKLQRQYDDNFGMELNWYDKQAIFIQKISFEDAKKVEITGYIEYMVCNDQTCLPPTQEKFSVGRLVLPQTENNQPEEATDQTKEETIVKNDATKDYWSPVVDELQKFGSIEGSEGSISLWIIFFTGLLGGFLALATPCVWPIIPMTVSFFLKRADNKSRGRKDAILYGISIIIIYITLGILITLIFGASALNDLSTSAVFNLFFFALLVLFAISFFGAFEITLPSSWATKLDAKADSTAGFISILLMAFTLVLVSFSCTGPIIGFLLVEVSGKGSILAPAIGMLGFAVALSIPFSLFAFFPSWLKTLPKSGGWLNSVKIVLAFLELAFALKFLSVADLAYGWRILDREVFIAIWIVLFSLLGMYLIGKLRFAHDSESKHTSILGIFLAIISFSFAVYMVPGMWGAPLKAISAFTPPLYTQDFNLYNEELHPAFTDYESGLNFAAERGKPVVIDFTGFGCVNCRKMETSVWLDPTVKKMLTEDFVLISLYVDDKTALAKPYEVEENGRIRSINTIGDKWSYLQRHRFGANAQPFYVMLSTDGKPINKPYTFDENPENFIKWLKQK